MKNPINIVKYSGDVVPFDVNKLINSIRRAQESEELIQQIVEQVEDQIYDGITTKKIYQMAFKILKGKSRVSASKYKLKKALMELGRQKGHEDKLHRGGVFTNTRFTTDAVQYGKCVGLLLTSWDYPMGNGLKDRIDKLGLHPLTALTTLTKAEKTKLLDTGIVLCKELHEKPVILKQIGIDKKRHKKILEDSEELCKST